MKKQNISMEIISDEEFTKMREKQEKESFFDSLLSASESSTRKMGFSVKTMKPKNEKSSNNKPKTLGKNNSSNDGIFRKSEYTEGLFNDEHWNGFLDALDDIAIERSPIDDITRHEIDDFAKKALDSLAEEEDHIEDPSTKYTKMFKKEIAMYAEILKDVNKQTRTVAEKLKALSSGKGQYGISKYYSDMLEQFNSLNNTKMSAVKGMADLKSKAEDFKLKQMKATEETELGVDDLVAQYYNNVMNGGRADYMSRSLLAQSPYEEDQTTYNEVVSGTYEMQEGQQIPKASWNITQPIPEDLTNFQDSKDFSNADKYGYIQNEYRNPEICIQRFPDDRLSFIALDEDGLEIEGYELPGDDLLESMSIKPMSNFAYDKYGRKYTIIDINMDGVDLSDLDDSNYVYDK